MATLHPSSTFLSKTFKDLSIKYAKELDKPTINQNKEAWVNSISTEILKLILDRIRSYNAQNMESLSEEDVMRLLSKLNYYYGLELKVRN